jgi:hypothetical protein
MKNRTKWIASMVILILVLALTVTAVSAAVSSSSFRIPRDTMSSAQAPGGVMSSASYQLEGVFGGMIGQSGGGASSTLCIGYICAGSTSIFLPLIMR